MVDWKMEKKDKDFSRFYHEIIDNGLWARLSNAAARVYPTILRHANYKTLLSFPTVETIRKESGVNKNSICAATEELEHFGLIEKFQAPKRFNFRNGYRIIEHPKVVLDNVPQKADKCKRIFRGKDGRFKPIPKKADNGIPQNVDIPIPPNTELDTYPKKTDKKDTLETKKRDNVLEGTSEASATKGSRASASGNNKSIRKINPEIINGLIKDKGLDWVKKYLRDQGYDQKELEFLEEVN